MGLYFYATIEDFGLPAYTPYYGFEPDYEEGMAVFASTFLDEAQDRVPVDTGNLMSSIDANPGYDDIICETDCEYAQYVEFGTYKMRAQPYFIPALKAAYREAKPLWKEAWHDAIEEERELIELEEEAEAAEEKANEKSISARMGDVFAQKQSEIATNPKTSFGGMIGGSILAAIVLGFIVGFFNMISEDDTIRSTSSPRSTSSEDSDIEEGMSGILSAEDMEAYVEIT